MDDAEIRLKCLELGMTGQASQTVENAKVYYEWIKAAPPKRRGRPPLVRDDITEEPR